MRTTYITAIVIALVIGLWLWSGQVNQPETTAPKTLAEQNREADAKAEDNAPTRVRGRIIQASIHERKVRIRGRTQNKRTVEVRSELAGKIIQRPIERGTAVAEGQLLCQLAMDDRQAGLTEARAALAQSQIEYQGAKELKAKGFNSDTAIAQARARLASAEAQVTRRRLDIARTKIRAPFAGYVEDVAQEVGDYVTPGVSCATVVDLDPMLLIGRVPERDVHKVVVGAIAQGVFPDGSLVEGEVSFVGTQSEAATRTYPIEVRIPNPDGALRSGVTTDIMVPVEEILAHKVSPALFALDDAGTVGLRTVNDDNRVEFHPVNVLSSTTDGAWVTGLPATTTLITVGQELVIPGDAVEVSFEARGEMPASAPADVEDGERTSGLLPDASQTQGAAQVPNADAALAVATNALP